MLAEALVYARARLAGEADSYGHLAEQVAMAARRRRCRNAWAGHLERARALCLAAADARPPEARRTALVLGAGLLLDVPVAELAKRFRRVVLADACFLPSVRRSVGGLPNVECVEADLSGCLARLAGRTAGGGGPPSAPVPDLSLGLPDVDFAYSANLLSQMPLFALKVLRKRNPDLDDDALENFAASMVRAHLAALSALPAACLVTDVTERGFARRGPDYVCDLLFGAAPDLPGERWTWRMAPNGEAGRGLDVEREVLGAPDIHAERGKETP